MNVCRFETEAGDIRVGIVADDAAVLDLSAAGVHRMQPLLESAESISELTRLSSNNLPRIPLSKIRLRAPVEGQEVWAAGVTYSRSKKARMEESDFSANAYDRVYEAERPELFFKSIPEKVVGPGEPIGIRRDSKWSVPEPELALVLNSRGNIAGYTIGNDMSARDIEGENLLYLPQAKIYQSSCALGPWISVGVTEKEAREWMIGLKIKRDGTVAFSGETSVGRITRTFDELGSFLFRSQSFPGGAVLLTGTGIVPPDDFALQGGDAVSIEISGIGSLNNPVAAV